EFQHAIEESSVAFIRVPIGPEVDGANRLPKFTIGAISFGVTTGLIEAFRATVHREPPRGARVGNLRPFRFVRRQRVAALLAAPVKRMGLRVGVVDAAENWFFDGSSEGVDECGWFFAREPRRALVERWVLVENRCHWSWSFWSLLLRAS